VTSARRRRAIGAPALVLLLLATAPVGAQETSDYTVSRYELTVELRTNLSARVTMDLTYRIRSGAKSEGFKYIAQIQPQDVDGFEDDGSPMRMSVERQRETLIRWRFKPAGRGEKRVRVRFTVPDAFFGSAAANFFEAPWAGVFRIPVERAIYRLVGPEGWTPQSMQTRPAGSRETTYEGRPAVEVEQQPLRETSFSVTVQPGIVSHDVPAPSRAAAALRPDSSSGDGSGNVILMVALVVGFIVIASIARKKKKGQEGADGGSFAGSCAGGSSCSSSCGGGGCGGGCGG
jgi:hypothetical protein